MESIPILFQAHSRFWENCCKSPRSPVLAGVYYFIADNYNGLNAQFHPLYFLNLAWKSQSGSKFPEMGDNLLSDGLQMPGPVFPGTGDGENYMASASFDILLKPGDAAFYRPK